MCLFQIIHSRACTGICFPHTKTVGSFSRFNLSLVLWLQRGNYWQGQLAQLFMVPFVALLAPLLPVWFKASWVCLWSPGDGIQCSLGGTENRALEEGVSCCQEEMTQMFLGCSWPGFAVVNIHRLASKLAVATSNRNSVCCTKERGSGHPPECIFDLLPK